LTESVPAEVYSLRRRIDLQEKLQWEPFMDTPPERQLSELTADIVSAYVSNNSIRPEELTSLIAEVHVALARTPSLGSAPAQQPREPAVSVRKSVTANFIICLEEGKKFKSMKRHLRSSHDMSPAEYREKWGLKPDYPMVAPNYATARSDFAKAIGLGRKSKAGSEPGEGAEPISELPQSQREKQEARRSEEKEPATD
jgi:predicted transcriptional regulator